MSIQDIVVITEPLCDVVNLLLSSNNITKGHLVKIEWLVSNVTAVVSRDRAERAILGMILAGCVFCQSRGGGTPS